MGTVVGKGADAVDVQSLSHLVGALVGAGAPQPDLVLAEVRRDVSDDLAHRQALAAAELARQPRRLGRLQDQPQLLRQLA